MTTMSMTLLANLPVEIAGLTFLLRRAKLEVRTSAEANTPELRCDDPTRWDVSADGYITTRTIDADDRSQTRLVLTLPAETSCNLAINATARSLVEIAHCTAGAFDIHLSGSALQATSVHCESFDLFADGDDAAIELLNVSGACKLHAAGIDTTLTLACIQAGRLSAHVSGHSCMRLKSGEVGSGVATCLQQGAIHLPDSMTNVRRFEPHAIV